MIIIDVLGDAEESSTIDKNKTVESKNEFFDITKIPQLQIIELSRNDRPHVITPTQALCSISGIYNCGRRSVN